MELRHLRYFVAVAEELNFRKASERLRVAQPALSRQIQDLESDVGVRLLDRNTTRVRLTDAGAAFLEQARLVLEQSQQAIVIAQEAAQGLRGRLNIGYLAPLLTGFMPPTLAAFHAKYPNAVVSMAELTSAEQWAALESGAIHVGFGVKESSAPLPKTFAATLVARSPFRAVVSRGHRLAKRSKIALADLIQEPLLALRVKKGVAPHVEAIRRILSARGLKPPPITAIEGDETFLATLESGIGVTLMGETGSFSRGRGLLFKPLKETGDDLMIELRVIWRRNEASPLVKNFVDRLLKVRPDRI